MTGAFILIKGNKVLGDGWARIKMIKEDLTAREQFQLKDTSDVLQNEAMTKP